MAQTITVVGMTNTFYVTNELNGHNCNFTVTKKIGERHSIYGYLKESGKPVVIELSDYETECSSGWCIATYADISIKDISAFPPFAYVPSTIDRRLEITIDPNEAEINCPAFEFSSIGQDEWYPAGFYFIKYDAFEETPRYSDERVVFILVGEHDSEKKYLTDRLNRSLKVYETDSAETLPEVIYEDVVVVGNERGYVLEDVKSRLFDNPIARVCVVSSLEDAKPSALTKERDAFVFTGPSGVGKSYLTGKLIDSVKVYETDSSETLPETIDAEVVVVGNKHGHTREDVKIRLGTAKVRVCAMS